MRRTAIAFWVFLGLLIVGVGTCVPGICGCAFSWLPASWEEYDGLPALIADGVGLVGCAVSGLLFLVLLARRRTIESGQAALAKKHD